MAISLDLSQRTELRPFAALVREVRRAAPDESGALRLVGDLALDPQVALRLLAALEDGFMDRREKESEAGR